MIGLLTTFFAVVTLGIVVAALYRFRRAPIVWLMTKHDSDRAYHAAAAAALTHALDAERAAGKTAHADRLAAALTQHQRTIKRIDASREFAGTAG